MIYLNNLIFKKRYFFYILILIIIILLSITAYSENNPVYIIIDPGHGGRDSGAVAADGTLEKELNLSVALNLRDFFQAAGYNTVMTRETDTDTDGDGIEKFNKSKDILNRIKYTEKYPNSIYISVHMNSSDSSQNKGFQVFYGWKNENSKNLAQSIYNIIKKADAVNRLRDVKKSPDTVYIFRNVTVPAVLVECGFIRNREDFVLLADEEYQKTIAFILFCGISEYINS
ncbi:MAG: cell wall hydrolase/autolysin [Clostridia bacterium]|nr:cell wall hydrolase/autolysin [Clostridia bacterium]